MRRVMIATTLAALTAGCGGDDEQRPRPKPPTKLTAAQVQERFQALTEDRLAVDREFSDERETILDPTASFTERAGLYGSYSFRVYKDAKTAKAESADGFEDAPIKPVEGIYWIQYPGDDSWEARQVFLNFVLVWEAPDERKVTDERWERLVRVADAIATDGALPAEDRPCDQVGIDPAKGKAGTCKLGGQLIVVVNRGTRLETPGVYAQIERVEQGEQIDVTGRSQPLARARGTFVFARIRMTNRTGEELTNPFVELALGRRRFKDSGVGFRFKSDFPLDPGESGAVTFVYDVPKSLGERTLEEGGLLLPGDEEQFVTVPDATVLGRLRLAR